MNGYAVWFVLLGALSVQADLRRFARGSVTAPGSESLRRRLPQSVMPGSTPIAWYASQALAWTAEYTGLPRSRSRLSSTSIARNCVHATNTASDRGVVISRTLR